MKLPAGKDVRRTGDENVPLSTIVIGCCGGDEGDDKYGRTSSSLKSPILYKHILSHFPQLGLFLTFILLKSSVFTV
jgi:hypothetical protein